MPIKKYRVDTDKGSYIVEVDEPESAPATEPKPAEGPSTRGFLQNAFTSAGDNIAGMGKGILSLVKDPGNFADNLTGGMRDRLKEYAGDIHPGEALDRLKAGHPIEALSNILPVTMMYQDPAGVALDAAAGVGAVKAGKAAMKVPGKLKASRDARRLKQVLDPHMPNRSALPDGQMSYGTHQGLEVQGPIINRQGDGIPYGSPPGAGEGVTYGPPRNVDISEGGRIPYGGEQPLLRSDLMPSGTRLIEAPELSGGASVLQTILDELTAEPAATGSTWTKPAPTITDAGREGIPGALGKGQKGRPMTSYSSGRPSVDLQRYDDMQPHAATEAPTVEVPLEAPAPVETLPWGTPVEGGTPMTLDEMRSSVGAERTASELGMSADDVRAGTGTSRQPLLQTNADLDSRYRRMLSDERGFASPDFLLHFLTAGMAQRMMREGARGAAMSGLRALPGILPPTVQGGSVLRYGAE